MLLDSRAAPHTDVECSSDSRHWGSISSGIVYISVYSGHTRVHGAVEGVHALSTLEATLVSRILRHIYLFIRYNAILEASIFLEVVFHTVYRIYPLQYLNSYLSSHVTNSIRYQTDISFLFALLLQIKYKTL